LVAAKRFADQTLPQASQKCVAGGWVGVWQRNEFLIRSAAKYHFETLLPNTIKWSELSICSLAAQAAALFVTLLRAFSKSSPLAHENNLRSIARKDGGKNVLPC